MSDIAKLKNWILEYMSSLLSIEVGEIDPSQRLSYYGLNSKNSIQFVMELSALVNREYDATLVWDYPTVNDLVEFLSNTASKNKQAISHKTGQIDGKEPIAIVGIGCRFPNAQNKSAYWDLLKNNFSGIRKVPEEKWNSSDYFDEDIAAPGKMNTQYGGFLDNLYDFDPEFFGISPKEAKYIDPQQRLVLEVTWEALDDAGVEIKKLKGSKTGVFNGAIWSDYAGMCQKLGDEKINKYTATGNHHSIISNRVSYLLGLQGPSMTIDTACSSSLVAVHLAAQSLRSGETDMALAGGVNLILSPEGTLSMSKLGAMAPDGQSKAFDKRANGYVRGEGAGVIVLKRLSSAIKDGDRIYSVILNSANNNDGFSNGLTAPSPQAQEKVLRAAYEGTGLEPDDVRFIEAHGTGTKLGDPIEAKAIGKVLGEQRKPTNPLVLGSVKSQIGHLEGAAGIAGLIKLALSIKNRVIPANLNFDEPNPDIPFEKYNLRVADQPLNWPDKEKAIGGVTSIGFGGSNCHVVLSEYQRTLDNLLVVSGKDISQAKSKLEEISIELREVDSGDFRRLCYQFNKMYTPSSTNVAIVFSDLEDLAIKIEKVGKEDNEEIIISESHRPQRPLVFVCSGQGAKWSGTVKQLYKVNTVFRSVISKCDKELEKYTRSFSIADFLLNGETGDQNSAEVLQPSYVAIQIALSELWKSWGVSPDALIGHSLGELSSAYIGGFLSLADTMKVAYYRGLQYEKVIAEGKGLTALVSLTEEQISAYIKDYNGKVEIVVSNSKQSNVVSGDIEAMEELLAKFEKDGVENRKLNIGNMGAHSYLMEGITDEFYDQISDIRPLWGDTDFYSTALDCKLSPYDYDRSYWVRNIRNHVKFSSVVDKLLPADPIFLELGPHPILTEAVVSISKNNERNDAVSLFSLKKGIPDQTSMYLNLATLATEGYKVSFSKVFGMENTDEETVDTLIPISAHTSKALINEAVSITKGLDKKEYSSDDLVYSITKNRVSFNNKLALTVNKNTTFSEIEDALKNGGYHTNLIRQEKSIKNKKIAFVFSGQGSQYLNLGIGLYKSYEVFRNKISECSLILKSKFNLNWDLKDLILTETNADLLTETEVLQPVIFSIQVALAELWKSFGIIPDGVV
ncbi:MAG: beta-ketoacyl synthase N-terminal-like domain-containing protein, partial [Bacteroidota bacterium]